MGNKKTFLALTGFPGVGKTTYGQELQRQYADDGQVARFVDEYRYIVEWAIENSDRTDLVGWVGDSPILDREAYAFATRYSATKIAEEAKRLFDEGVDVVIAEGARGAYGVDSYGRDFFEPIMEVLSNGHEGDMPQLINVEICAPIKSALERAKIRFEENPLAPPPEIPARYVDPEMGDTYSNAVESLQGMSPSLDIVFNGRVVNDNGIEGVQQKVEGIYHMIQNGSGVEGQLSSGCETI